MKSGLLMMNHQGKKPLRIIDLQCSKFVEPLKKGFTDSGLWAFQSFDLQSTRALHEGCTCAYHGTSQCNCQLVVLLVYRAHGDPITLVLDGRDEQTYLFIVDDKGPAIRSATREVIERIIIQTAQKLLQQTDVVNNLNIANEQL